MTKVVYRKISNLNKFIDDTCGNRSKSTHQVQRACVASLERMMDNGDIRPFKRILSGLGEKSADARQVANWFLANAPIVEKVDKDGKVVGFTYHKSLVKKVDVEAAKQNMWIDAPRPKRAASTFDAEKRMQSWAKQLIKNHSGQPFTQGEIDALAARFATIIDNMQAEAITKKAA